MDFGGIDRRTTKKDALREVAGRRSQVAGVFALLVRATWLGNWRFV